MIKLGSWVKQQTHDNPMITLIFWYNVKDMFSKINSIKLYDSKHQHTGDPVMAVG